MSLPSLRMVRWVATVAVLLALSGPLAVAAKRKTARAAAPPRPAAAAPRPAPPPAAVKYHQETLFVLRANLGPYSPADRARSIEERLGDSDSKRGNQPSKITLEEQGDHTNILLDGVTLTSVTEADAQAEGVTRHALALQEAEALRDAVTTYRSSLSFIHLLLAILYTVLLTAALLTILWLLARFGPRFEEKLMGWERRIPSLRIQSVELISSRQMVTAAAALARVLRWILVLFLLYFWLVAVFSFYPRTHGLAPVLLSYGMRPVQQIGGAIIAYIPNLLVIAVAVFFTRIVLRFARLIFTEIGRGSIRFAGFYPEWAQPTYKIVRLLILAILAVIIFPYLPGSKSPAFQGISIFIGVLLSLGSGSSVANVISGVVLTYTRAFQIGDRVKIGDSIGDVMERTLLMTRIRTIKNEEISIPNSLVMSSAVINYSTTAHDGGLILHTSVTIGYDSPWRTIHQLLISAALAVPGIEASPAPFVLQTALDDFYVSYEINAYTRIPHDMARLYSDLHQQIQDKFNEAGMEIMSPHYASLRDGNTIAIPEQDRPKDYQRPGFKVEMADGEPSSDASRKDAGQ